MSDPRADAARYRAEQDMGEEELGAEGERAGAGSPQWATQEQRWAAVETAIQLAIRRGEFDDLPGAGKPLEGLDGSSDPNWWIRRKIENEGMSGIAPPAIQLRNEHRAMDATLDELSRESDVRAHLDDFNSRVRHARLQLEGGPPVVTPTHDVDADVSAWRERRAQRSVGAVEARGTRPDSGDGTTPAVRSGWWRRFTRGR